MAKNLTIPANYHTVMPYLIIKDAAAFIAFTQKVFNATETYKVMRNENCIMHAEIMIDGSTIMFADCTDQFCERTAGLFIYVENADETYQKAIDEGAAIESALSDQPYGRSGGIKDPFGNTWWITSPL